MSKILNEHQTTLPVLNMEPLLKARQEGTSFAQSRGAMDACQKLFRGLHETGFLYVKGHGIETSLQKNLERLSKAFFGQSHEEKMRIRMENAGRAWRGYFPVGAELTSQQPDQKEGLYFGTEHESNHPLVIAGEPMHGANQWPKNLEPEFSKVVTGYMRHMGDIGAVLMSAIAVGLGLEETYFSKRFLEDPTTLFRIFHYPTTDWATHENLWSVGEHTDMGFLTILKQDESGGLEVQHRQGQWLPVPPMEESFVLNIGDMLELWTWGLLRATPHRVRNPAQKGRLSYPYFFDPSWRGSLERIDRKRLAKTAPFPETWGAEKRWDQLDLQGLDRSHTYGAFVWRKIRSVFPSLSNS